MPYGIGDRVILERNPGYARFDCADTKVAVIVYHIDAEGTIYARSKGGRFYLHPDVADKSGVPADRLFTCRNGEWRELLHKELGVFQVGLADVLPGRWSTTAA